MVPLSETVIFLALFSQPVGTFRNTPFRALALPVTSFRKMPFVMLALLSTVTGQFTATLWGFRSVLLKS